MSIAPETNPIRPRKLQFSLRALFLMALLVALAVSYWISMRQTKEMERLRTENERIRNQFGDLTIEPGTEDKLHLISVPEPSLPRKLSWQWQVYVPPGANVCTAPFIGPDGGRPRDFENPFKSGVVRVELHHDPVQGWSWIVGNPLGTLRIPITGAARNAKDFRASVRHHGGAGQTAVVDEGAPFEMLRVEAIPIDADGTANNADRTGINLWIMQKLPAGTPLKQ